MGDLRADLESLPGIGKGGRTLRAPATTPRAERSDLPSDLAGLASSRNDPPQNVRSAIADVPAKQRTPRRACRGVLPAMHPDPGENGVESQRCSVSSSRLTTNLTSRGRCSTFIPRRTGMAGPLRCSVRFGGAQPAALSDKSTGLRSAASHFRSRRGQSGSHLAEDQDMLLAHRVTDSLDFTRDLLVQRHPVRLGEFSHLQLQTNTTCLIRV